MDIKYSILVTGGADYNTSKLVSNLLKTNIRWLSLVNLCTGFNEKNLKWILQKLKLQLFFVAVTEQD